MHRTLRDFLETLDRAGELHRVAARVSPILEIAAIADRASKSPCALESPHAQAFDPDHASHGGRALLFERVEGCDFPLAINVFGSYRRIEMALGVHDRGGFASIAARLASLTKPQPPRGLRDMLAKVREFWPLLRIPPKRVRRGVCQEVVKLTTRGEVDLTRLPLIKCWPFDGDPRKVGYDFSPEQAGTAKGEGRYITFAGMHTVHADDRDDPKPPSHNIGMYRAQLIDATRLAMHWHMHHDGAAHWRSWKALASGAPMPIAICFGGESVLPYAATSPLPPGLSELLMAGFLNGRGIPMVRAKTVPLWVPANSEIVIEGWVSTGCGGIGWEPGGAEPLGPGAVFEGPFGDHTGFYSLPDRYPIVEVSAITHRHNAIFPATIVGLPPQEDYAMGKATERIFLPLLRTLVHDIDDYHLPMFGCFHNCAFVRIRKAYPLQARRVMHAIWGAGQMAWTKFIVVVDDDVNVHDESAVLRAMAERCHFCRDIELVHGPVDILDHAAAHLGAAGKMGFDATRKVTGESVNGVAWNQMPALASRDRHTPLADDDFLLPRLGGGRIAFLRAKASFGNAAVGTIEAFMATPAGRSSSMVIAVDESVNLDDWQRVFFEWCANVDPARDAVRTSDGRIAFDATRKSPGASAGGVPIRRFPPLLEMDEATKSLIDRRWGEYGFQ